jgi:glycosyltransferase involved in cell wall biosynthesis
MKVMQIMTRINRGGTAKWLEILAGGLAYRGCESPILCGNVQNGETEDPIFNEFNVTRISKMGRSISLINDLSSIFQIRRQIKVQMPDIVNTHTSKAGLLGRLAVITIPRNKPAVVHTYHGHLLYGYFSKNKTRALVLIENFLSKFTQMMIVSGGRVKDELLMAGVGKKSQYFLVKPGIEEPKFADRHSARQSLGLSEDQIVVGWLGRFAEVKKPERVLLLASMNPHIKFVMGGNGELFDLISKSALPNLELTGWSTPEFLWGISDIGILTSDNEAQPIALVEAAMAGIPTIALNVGSIEGVISNGETGYLVNDIASMSEKINELAKNSNLRAQMGERAKAKMLSEFNVATFIESHLKVYELALKKTVG